MVTVAGCLEKGETMKKRKIMFAAVIVWTQDSRLLVPFLER